MHASAVAGGAPVPAPVQMYVHDRDVDAVQADFHRRRHGLVQLWVPIMGILLVTLGLVRMRSPHTALELWPLYIGIVYLGGTLLAVLRPAKSGIPLVLRPAELRFSETGIDVLGAFSGKPSHHYSWRGIRAINDIGEWFVLIPTFGTRVVIPKRDFSDGGREAWAFFAAHGVIG
jgi:hypothetical protein